MVGLRRHGWDESPSDRRRRAEVLPSVCDESLATDARGRGTNASRPIEGSSGRRPLKNSLHTSLHSTQS